MARKKFGEILNKLLYVEGGAPEAEDAAVTPEEMEAFEESMATAADGDDVTLIAKKIIADSQAEADSDEYPDISIVESVLETAGTDAPHELIRKILLNFAHCNPDDVEKDGVKRREYIQEAINQTKQRAEALKAEKNQDEQSLIEAERAAEATCTAAITQANEDSEKAIEAEKARSAAIIEEIRQRTDAATEEAKKARDTTLESIAAQRAENADAIRKATNLVAETEKHGMNVINQINTWIDYLN